VSEFTCTCIVYLLLMNFDLLAQEFESELGLLRQQREVSVRTANSRYYISIDLLPVLHVCHQSMANQCIVP